MRKLIKAADKNNDGEISIEEFKDLILEERPVQAATFHDQTDFIFDSVPGELFESL